MGESSVIATNYLSFLKTAFFLMDEETHDRFWYYVRDAFDEERPLTMKEKQTYFDRAVERDSLKVRHFLQPVIDKHVAIFEERMKDFKKGMLNVEHKRARSVSRFQARARYDSDSDNEDRGRCLMRRCSEKDGERIERGRSTTRHRESNQRGRSGARVIEFWTFEKKDRGRSKSRGPVSLLSGTERIWVQGRAVKFVIGKDGRIIGDIEKKHSCSLKFLRDCQKPNGDMQLEIHSFFNDGKDVAAVIALVRGLEMKAWRTENERQMSPDFQILDDDVDKDEEQKGDDAENSSKVEKRNCDGGK